MATSTQSIYNASNDSVEIELKPLKDDLDNDELDPRPTSWCKRYKKVMIFGTTGIVAVVVFVLCVSLANHNGDSDPIQHMQAIGFQGPESLTDARETVDPFKHFTRCDADPTLQCNDKAVPYRRNQLEENENASYWEYLHTSSCLFCDGTCFRLESLLQTKKEIKQCSGTPIPIKTCSFRRDMMNKDDGVCGSVGKYVCYSEDAVPECQCFDNHKLGARCDEDFKVTCKCFQTKSPLACGEKYPACMEDKRTEWDNCTVNYPHQDLKCVCSKSVEGNLQDCSKAQTDAQTGTNDKTGTNCCSSAKRSMGVVLGVCVVLLYFIV